MKDKIFKLLFPDKWYELERTKLCRGHFARMNDISQNYSAALEDSAEKSTEHFVAISKIAEKRTQLVIEWQEIYIETLTEIRDQLKSINGTARAVQHIEKLIATTRTVHASSKQNAEKERQAINDFQID